MLKDTKGVPPEALIVLKANCDSSKCEITHYNEPTNRPAVNYIQQQFRDFLAVIPICETCVERLHSNDWILLYCVQCGNSIWIYKPNSLRQYHYPDGEHIKWMNECHKCFIWEDGDHVH